MMQEKTSKKAIVIKGKILFSNITGRLSPLLKTPQFLFRKKLEQFCTLVIFRFNNLKLP